MKCVGCGHVSAERNPKFCSECGARFPSQVIADDNPKSLTAGNEGPPLLIGDESSLDGPQSPTSPTSPKRPLEEPNNNSKAKKKPRKRRKKKKHEGRDSLQSITSDLSDTSLGEREARQDRGGGDADAAEADKSASDSESSASAMDESADPVASPLDNPTPLSPVIETQEPLGSPPVSPAKTPAPLPAHALVNTTPPPPPRAHAVTTTQSPPGMALANTQSPPGKGSAIQSPSTNSSATPQSPPVRYEQQQQEKKASDESVPDNDTTTMQHCGTEEAPGRERPEHEQLRGEGEVGPETSPSDRSTSAAWPVQTQTAGPTSAGPQDSSSNPDSGVQDTNSKPISEPEGLTRQPISRVQDPNPEDLSRQSSSGQSPSEGKLTAADQTQAKGSDGNRRSSQKSKKNKEAANTPTPQPPQDSSANADKSSHEGQTPVKKGKGSQSQTPGSTGTVSSSKPQTRSQGKKAEDHPLKTEEPRTDAQTPGNKNANKKQTTTQTKGSQQKVFGPQSSKDVSEGSSVDARTGPGLVEHSEVQQRSTAQSEDEADRESDDDSGQGTSKPPKTSPPPARIPTRGQQIAATERVTIYFHAVLSKDFKLTEDDRVFLRAGGCLGDWKHDIAELTVSRDLGEHGYLIEGKIHAKKSGVTSVSIPYKYVVYKKKKDDYEFEYIYKLDAHKTTNRCLFIIAHLLNEEGEWHQYDDIVCAPPSKNLLKRITSMLWSEKRDDLIKGRNIAGRIMLQSIFDLLSSWSEVNLKSFLTQLKQFHQIYANPFVFEEKQEKWISLRYDETDVNKLVKDFMLDHVTPELRKEEGGTRAYIKEPLYAAVIMLYVWRTLHLPLIHAEFARLCVALCPPDLPKDQFLPYWEEFQQSFSCVKGMTEMLVTLISNVYSKSMHHWVLVLPLLHLERGSCKPFEAVPFSGTPRYEMAAWAGLQGIRFGNIPLSSQDRSTILNSLKKHPHLLKIDLLLARSVMSQLTLEDLTANSAMLNPELLDLLHIFHQKVPSSLSHMSTNDVSDVVTHIQTSLLENKYSCSSDAYGTECLNTSVKLLTKICKGVHYQFHEVPIACMSLVGAVSDFTLLCNKQESEDGLSQQNVSLLSDAMEVLRTWMAKTFTKNLLHSYLSSVTSASLNSVEAEMWNNIISRSFKSEDFTTRWRNTFTRDFEGKFQREDRLDQVDVYCSKMEDLSNSLPHIARSIETCALKAVTALCQAKSEGDVFQRVRNFTWNRKFGNLLSTMILQSWPKDKDGVFQDDQELVIRHLLDWNAAKNIFQLQDTEQKFIELLSDEAKLRISVAISAFTYITEQLIKGSIQIRLLRYVLERKDTFTTLLNMECLCEDQRLHDGSAMRTLLQQREEEVKAVQHDKTLLDGFLNMCHKLQEHLKVDVKRLEGKNQVDIETMDLDEFMPVHVFGQLSTTQTVTFFELDENMRDMAEVLHTFRDSYIFKLCWNSQALEYATLDDTSDESDREDDLDEADMAPVTPDIIHDEIFQPCFSRYQQIYAQLKNGRFRLEQVDEVLKDFKGKYPELSADLAIMCRIDPADGRHWIKRKVQQIEQYHELHLAVESAQVVHMVKETLCLQGDFDVLDLLLQVTNIDFKKESLDRIDNDMMQAKTVLVDITETRRVCLQELGLRKNFVMWVKEALEDINELKVFVDLASISAGENDLDVDRVACFHDAVLGYAPMLYELKPHSGFQAFKETLKKLWKALDNDANLPKKLRDTARHLEWLKTVKDSHGSVELSSLSLASAINKKGIYIISAQGQKKLTLDTVIRLQIPEEHEEGQELRNYSLEDLRELQNKLMLMSGKGDQGQCEVDQFAEVFANVQRLAVAFIDLFIAGSPLFRHWEANINLKAEQAAIIMDFGLGSAINMIIIEGSPAEQLPDLCKKMETCLSFWNNFMDNQRSCHYYLNYFTAEQIVYLSSKLTQKSISKPDSQALMMLSFIKQDCNSMDLREAWHSMQYFLLKEPPEKSKDLEFQTFIEGSHTQKMETAAQAMDTELQAGTDGGVDGLYSKIQTVPGPGKLDLIWNAYMRDMNAFLPDSLDVGCLGKLLEILTNQVDEVDSENEGLVSWKTNGIVQRELPHGLVGGRPNLIVCPAAEILMSCISIYMASRSESLPTYDEILLCGPATPYEQVELFLRRCMMRRYDDGTRKIYVMLYVGQLSYEVSVKVEQFFHRQKMQSQEDYRLVLMCSSDREGAYIPSAFSHYRLHIVPQEPLAMIQEYLASHYKVSPDRCSASAVFKSGLFVGVVTSKRAGVGKSLYIQRMYEKLKSITKKPSMLKCIRLLETRVDENAILHALLNSMERKELTIFHFDVTTSVQKGLNEFLFKLLVLRYLMDSKGRMWKCSNNHLYLIELLQPDRTLQRKGPRSTAFLDVFPMIFCRPPKEVLELEVKIHDHPHGPRPEDPLMDDKEFRSVSFQRPYQYLTRFHNRESLDNFMYNGVEGTHIECLQMMFFYCGIIDPSWAELRNFAWFLNLQLQDCETSVFCDASFTGDTLQGFKNFVVDFMILMAKDFATPSLSISDQSPGRFGMDLEGVNEEDLAPFRIRKRWESEPHPYIFFNDDHISMTFIGFHLQPNAQNGVDAVDPSSGRVIKSNIMSTQLYEGLKLQRVPFNIDFDQLQRGEKIERLCNVLGIQWPLDPDETYELTTDNILKMLAIHMRFRCGIPVIIMGETGCGKTRLIKFLCELRRSGVNTENMKLVKVHGGTNSDMLYEKVREAETIASINKEHYGFDSVLFFDEANTTEAISSIKEVLCDHTVMGEKLTPNTGLQVIAACNPYRKHTDVMIKRLESAGLGYRVRADETEEKLGTIPLRQLVYRVQSLPPSMIPLVWDFGQLNDQTEKMYIQQIVQRVAEKNSIDMRYISVITDVMASSQKYMRSRRDECSFVSLRDVERCMQTFVWFYNHHSMLFDELRSLGASDRPQRLDLEIRDPVLWSLVMAIGVCYHACLEDKDKYRKKISAHFRGTYTHTKIRDEISLMQDLMLSGVPLGNTIARNKALKENVFMMVICIELRIPLFLVGKPGSSKSLSKTLVADAMQGQAAHSELYRQLKQIHLVSFQCSPHSTPDGIINTFKQCARFQEGKNLKEYVSVVVLDEIGLAEDSPKMPLKTLHPLLEEGCIDDQPLPHKKVGFIGISNWALDPAKMNRGIFVSRGDPDEGELIESAKGICSSDPIVLETVREFFQPFARAYLKICKQQGKGFFGLRDYYSLIKMVFAMAKDSEQKPSAEKIVEAVLRNFSGRDDVYAVEVFTSRLQVRPNLESISAIKLVRQNITAIGQDEECRYLLVLTKNYAALQIIQQTFFTQETQPEIIFGSSFPKDQEYTQICRNINRVKICMETGKSIMLLNLHNLYESLYDALNQYYVCLGGQKYVDLGLGTHRVKCRVHKDFRLIVIEEKEVVYEKFPIPLINRLEKHYLDINTVLRREQKEIVKDLDRWVKAFVVPDSSPSLTFQVHKYQLPDVFIGYHSDTCSSVILQITEKLKDRGTTDDPETVLQEAKLVLLNCATPDAIVRLHCTKLSRQESQKLERVYFEEQKHSCFTDFIFSHIQQAVRSSAAFTEVTTFSRLLTASDLGQLKEVVRYVELLSLQQFDTEYSFLKKIRTFLDTAPGQKILIIQMDFDEATQSSNLIASAKYSAANEINKTKQEQEGTVFVYFITKLPRIEGGTSYVGFHGGPWTSVHIDDLRRSRDMAADIKALRNITISQLFEEKQPEQQQQQQQEQQREDTAEAMEVEDMYSETNQEPMEQEEATEVGGWASILDTTALVRSCVQSAVGMLRDEVEGGVRSTRRVELLLTLMSNQEELQSVFLRSLKRRLHLLLVARDEGQVLSAARSWVFREAANIDALQEGGTFRHTLWKRVQAVVVPFLAQLISVLDRDCNLDLLLDPQLPEPLKDLWIHILQNDKLLEVPYTRLDSSEAKTILVPSSMGAGGVLACSLPFSWRIRDYLEELWVHALQREGHSDEQFERIYWKTPLGREIDQLGPEVQLEILQRYLQDFVAMTMKVTSKGELELLCAAVLCCVNELYESLREEGETGQQALALSWVHSGYHHYCTRLQNLSRMLCIEPHITHALLDNTHIQQGQELVLDVYAALACVEFLEPSLEAEEQCSDWLRRVKQLQVPVELVCAEESIRSYGQRSKAMVTRVQHGWSRILSLSLFVEHMLLGIQTVDPKLTPLLVERTKQLAQVLSRNPDLKQQQPFEAVLVILKECKDGAVERIFRFGVQLCPVCMSDPREPLALPCDHIYCLACARQWLVVGNMFCPLCMQPVPDDYQLQPSDKIQALITKNSHFRQRCNGFFIALVSSVCFSHDAPPSQAVILHLLSLLMVDAGTLPTITQNKRMTKLTKALSPFDDTVDRNPVVRSVVLKLLLKYSFEDVKVYLQQHLSAVERSNLLDETDKSELYTLYINCFEDSMFERMQWRSAREQSVCLQEEGSFLHDFLHAGPADTHAVRVDTLQQLARVRLALDTAADIISHTYTHTGGPEAAVCGSDSFLGEVRSLCVLSKNDWYRVYLIRKIRSQQGAEFIQMLLGDPQLQWMFPDEVLQKSQEGGQMDQFLVCEGGYKSIRDAVAKALIEDKIDRIQKACDACKSPPLKKCVYVLLALFREVTCLYRRHDTHTHPTQQQAQALEGFIAQCGALATPEQKAFAVGLVRNDLGPLTVRPEASGADHTITELCIHLAAVLLCGHAGVLSPLQRLALRPADMQAAYLPTMPDDMLHVAQQAMGQLQWYFCPNGHPCTVGECGQPMQVSRCPDCNVEIGGMNHIPVAGFIATGQQGDRTRRGHILGDPGRRDQPDMLDSKNMSPAPFSMVRLLTHAAMMLGAANNAQALAALLSPAVPDCGVFVRAHLHMDLLQLTRALGKGADDTTATVHMIIQTLLEPPHTAWPANYDAQLSSKEARNNWETGVATTIISPQLKSLDRRLQEVERLVRDDERVSCSPVMRVMFGDPRLFLRSLPRGCPLHGPAVWSVRERLSLNALTHILEQQDGKDTLPLLWKFLQREPELRSVRYLPDILVLQRDLVKKFQNSPDLTTGTIRQFLERQRAAAWYKRRIDIFLKTWNKLRQSLAINGEIQLASEYCERDLDLESELQVLLPRRQGLGLCSTALVSYLIALHNDMVYTTDKHTGEETSYTVSPADLCELHVIRYDVERDVLPLVLSHCQYSVERGGGGGGGAGGALPDYDLPKIQQQLLTRFLQGKPRITLNGIPTLVNRHDRNYENIFRDVKAKVPQEPLPSLTLSSVTGELGGFSEVCEALGAVELSLGFLATTPADPHTQLGTYLQDTLQMGDHLPTHILKALSRCSLKHAVALWQLLSSLKSESMLRLKRDPFVGVSDDYKLPLDEEARRQLIGYLAKGGAGSFVLEMHEFLQLKLKGLSDKDLFRPDWGLRDTVVSYMERKDLDASPEVEQWFPEAILLAHSVDTWRVCVEYQQERSK
ncbi:E3 ubiquitin-protein ligase rnf213-alpha [Engraulis encrasicolus]|uniref:E3 ubiquitin-protein ligase rnf213-alpha n=1 Tax=Engraulis encrasicolus TaxID=184585 RepID=UPI002FD75E51